MTKIPRPFKACSEIIEDLESINYPVIASPKIDGWRSFNYDGMPRTCSGKTIPNIHTRELLSRPELEGLDGELLCSPATDPNAMQKAQSALSTIKGEPDFTWYIFDDWRRSETGYWHYWKDNFDTPYVSYDAHTLPNLPSFCKILPQLCAYSVTQLDEFVQECLAEGYEGVITRDPNSPYKHGRSTRKQEWMLKVKPWIYEEGVVVGFNEKKHNLNKATTNNLGYTERSTQQDGKVGANTLGSFTIQSPNYASTFKIGCGKMDDATKQLIWNTRKEKLNSICTFRHLSTTGMVDVPRGGQFVAFRAKEDIS